MLYRHVRHAMLCGQFRGKTKSTIGLTLSLSQIYLDHRDTYRNAMDPTLDAVLPDGLQRQTGEPTRLAPQNYDTNYVLPAHCEKPLQTIHKHALDDCIVFYEAPHVYTVNGVPTTISVTGLAHGFETPFVPEEAIRMMKTSRSQAWPRLEYVVEPQPYKEVDATRGLLVHALGKTLGVVPAHAMSTMDDPNKAKELIRSVCITAYKEEDAEYYTFSRAMTDDEIAKSWKDKGRVASNKGTEAHYLAECFFNGLPTRWWEPEMVTVFDFAKTHMIPKGMTSYNTEKEICCKDADLAGSIDLIVWDPSTKLHHIVDFKRSDKLKKDLRGYRRMKKPLDHLDDCKGAGYALQTSIYQYILERDYGMNIGERVLLSIHPDQPFVTSVPYLKAEVEYIMESRFAVVRARRRVADMKPEFKCSVSGAPLVDSVRLDDGSRVMEKMAQIMTEEGSPVKYTVDRETRLAFDAEVKRVMEEVPLPPKTSVAMWKKRMPEEGIEPFSA